MQPPTSTCGNLHLVGTLPKLRSQFPDPDQLYRPKRFYHWLVARAHVTCVFLNLSWEDDPTWLIFLGWVETTSQTTKMWFLSMCRSETSNMSTDTSSLGIWNSRLISWGISFPLPPKRSRKPWKTIFHYLGRIFFILLDLLPLRSLLTTRPAKDMWRMPVQRWEQWKPPTICRAYSRNAAAPNISLRLGPCRVLKKNASNEDLRSSVDTYDTWGKELQCFCGKQEEGTHTQYMYIN